MDYTDVDLSHSGKHLIPEKKKSMSKKKTNLKHL
jgi:hypothetical protein